ncbi:hypothetical protein OKW30_008002 [Paraburkholderia sp. Clong3]
MEGTSDQPTLCLSARQRKDTIAQLHGRILAEGHGTNDRRGLRQEQSGLGSNRLRLARARTRDRNAVPAVLGNLALLGIQAVKHDRVTG